MADAADSKSVEGNFMRVRVSPSADLIAQNLLYVIKFTYKKPHNIMGCTCIMGYIQNKYN